MIQPVWCSVAKADSNLVCDAKFKDAQPFFFISHQLKIGVDVIISICLNL